MTGQWRKNRILETASARSVDYNVNPPIGRLTLVES